MKPRSAVLLIGSPKVEAGASRGLGGRLAEGLEKAGVAVGIHSARRALENSGRAEEMLADVAAADLVVVSFPLYVDQLPAPVIWTLDRIAERKTASADPTRRPHLAVIVQCGFPETLQNRPAIAVMRRFAERTGFEWAGALALGMGGAVGGRPVNEKRGLLRHVVRALDLAAAALAEGRPVPDEAVALMGRRLMSYRIYFWAVNIGWRCQIRRNGKKLGEKPDLEARPDAPAPSGPA
jgi:hypothetical protein